MFKKLTVAAFALTMATAAQSAPVTFFGEDLTATTVGGTPEAARDNFVSNLASGVGVEDFEAPTTLGSISFPVSSGTVSATLSGGGTSITSGSGFGRFATSGSQFVQTGGGGDFAITFGSAIAAFGFYGTDIGDIGNSLTLRLTKSGGGTLDLAVGNTAVNSPNNSGSLLFFGFYDLTDTYTSIQFLNAPGSGDVFGFDDMIVGDRNQIEPNPIPLPAAGWLLLGALGGMGAMRRRSKKKS